MPGSFTVDPEPVPLSRPSRLLAVWRREGPGEYELLPNIRVLSIEAPAEGANTGSARFRYTFGDPFGDPGDPYRVDHVYPLDATGQHVVNNDDRLVVRMLRDDGSSVIMFDGFVRTPQADLGRTSEMVTFEAAGTPIREWDAPMGSALVRDASTPTDTEANVFVPTIRTRFNPDGHPNMTPEDADAGEEPQNYPIFLGPVWPDNKVHGETIRTWTLADAVRYILRVGNPEETWTSHGKLSTLTEDLVSIRPEPEDGQIDWEDPDTYVEEPIEVDDIDITQATWPEALEQLLTPYGFAMRFRLEDEEPGEDADEGTPTEPKWTLEIYRLDDLKRVKSLYLQEPGETFDPAATNVLELKLARDTSAVENMVGLATAPAEYEASFMLAPGFEPDEADVDTPETFEGADAGDKYRVWVFDECGEGHWDVDLESWVEDDPGDLGKVLNETDDADEPKFVPRRRPGIAKLVTKDGQGEARKAILHYSPNYDAVMPGVWDPDHSADWIELKSSEWELLDDRLGIRIKASKVTAVKGGDPKAADDDQFENGGVIDLLTWCATPTDDRPFPRFRLTCKVIGDTDLEIGADWRVASSITGWPIQRIHDERDRYKKQVISRYSVLTTFARLAKEDYAPVDDTKEAQGYAEALRRAGEAGKFAGSATLHGIRLTYAVGDKIRSISGRSIPLRMNLGETEGESAVYPAVVSVRWECDGEQRTILQLTDRRADPPRRKRKVTSD